MVGKVGIDQTTPGITNAVAVSGIKGTVISVRNQSVTAGGFLTVGSFLLSEGVRRVGGTVRSADTFSMQLYIAYFGEDNATLGNIGGGNTTVSVKNVGLSDMLSGKASIIFGNSDISPHTISVDAVGVPN